MDQIIYQQKYLNYIFRHHDYKSEWHCIGNLLFMSSKKSSSSELRLTNLGSFDVKAISERPLYTVDP